jgi:Protein of unknown function (DUF4019)
MKLTRAILLLTLAGAAPAAGQQKDSTSAAVAAAQTAADAWLKLIDHKRYGESWDSAASLFRRAISKPDWGQAVAQARGPYQPFGARKLLSGSFTTTLPNVPPGQYVVLQYETQVSGGRAVVETVTPMKDADGHWRASGYYVRPR